MDLFLVAKRFFIVNLRKTFLEWRRIDDFPSFHLILVLMIERFYFWRKIILNSWIDEIHNLLSFQFVRVNKRHEYDSNHYQQREE